MLGGDHGLENCGKVNETNPQRTPILVVFFTACGGFLAGLGRSWVTLGRSLVVLGGF